MNSKKLANNLLILGIVLLIAAVCWWVSFYGPIAQKLGVTLMRANQCLYSNDGLCRVAAGIAQLTRADALQSYRLLDRSGMYRGRRPVENVVSAPTYTNRGPW